MSMYQLVVVVAMADKGNADVYKTCREYQDMSIYLGITQRLISMLPKSPFTDLPVYRALLKDQEIYHNMFKVVVEDS